jgi:malonate decarboxylase beta subunit
MMHSYHEASARQRVAGILDADSFREIIPPTERVVSPHLQALDLPVAFDDGVTIGVGTLNGRPVLIAGQEGAFMGGAVGEVQGAKLAGLLERAVQERPAAVLLLLESGGVRLQEANAGLIAVSEVMRAILSARVAGVPVFGAIGGQYGCFGGMGIAASCCDALVMSEEGRLGLSGPEVIETAYGVEEFDARDRALVWRTVGGKHRYLLGDCAMLVDDGIAEFRAALDSLIAHAGEDAPFGLDAMIREHEMLARRLELFGGCKDGHDIWRNMGWDDPAKVPMLDSFEFLQRSRTRSARWQKNDMYDGPGAPKVQQLHAFAGAVE